MSPACLCFVLFATTHLANAIQRHFDPHFDKKVHSRFASFVQDFGRTYKPGSDEYARRFSTFALNAAAVDEHNAKPGKTWTAAVNHLSDWYNEELEMLRGLKGARRFPDEGASLLSDGAVVRHSTEERASLLSEASFRANTTQSELPNSANWSHLAVFGRVPNQGACGSCWAIASSIVLQAHSETIGAERTFSVDQLLKCVENLDECGGEGGCRGATPELAFDYVLTTTKMFMQENKTEHCPASVKPAMSMHLGALADATSFGLVGWRSVGLNKYNPVLEALQEGPVVAAVAAGGAAWRQYEEGVVPHPAKDSDLVIDHAVVLFAYGTSNGRKYWAIRNSWGSDWGNKGSMFLERKDTPAEEEAMCYEDSEPLKGVGCAKGAHISPSKVTVCGNMGILYDVVTVKFAAPA